MGTLGPYLRSARESRRLDLREAAQQTRISFQFLKALEEEDFLKLPGEVFVKGFLKSYARFLKLEEAEVMKRYAELKGVAEPASAEAATEGRTDGPPVEKTPGKRSFEPFAWGAAIIIVLFVFLFLSSPTDKRHPENVPAIASITAVTSTQSGTAQQAIKSEKLYLEIVALENVWVLVRTDVSPQKKAVLKKGESVIWSADERFILSYASVGAVKLLLNGKELVVNGPQNAVVRDLTVVASGIQQQQLKPKLEPRRRRHAPQAPVSAPQQQTTPQLTKPVDQPKPVVEPVPAPKPTPEPAAVQPDPSAAPVAPETPTVPAQ